MSLDRYTACDLGLSFIPPEASARLLRVHCLVSGVGLLLITFAKLRVKGSTEFREVLVSGETLYRTTSVTPDSCFQKTHKKFQSILYRKSYEYLSQENKFLA